MNVVDRIRLLVEPILVQDGLELFDIEYTGGRLVVLADRPGGIDLDALTRATQRINVVLDAEDPIPGGRYVLEVSSPGLERPLRTPAHFHRYVGSTVSVKTLPGVEGDRRCQGVLTGADDEGFTVGDRRFAYGDIERVRTVFEWGPPPRPAKGGRGAGAGKKAPPNLSTGVRSTGARTAPDRHTPSDQKASAS